MKSPLKKRVAAVITPVFEHESLTADGIQSLKETGDYFVSNNIVALCSASDRGAEWLADTIVAGGGSVAAFSPAANKKEQRSVYREETDWDLFTVFTGAGGKHHIEDILRSADVLLLPIFSKSLLPVIGQAAQVGVPVAILSETKKEEVVKMTWSVVDTVFSKEKIFVAEDLKTVFSLIRF